MAKEVSFLDAATKRGVTNIAQQGAQALGTLASAIGKQKAKEDKAAKEQLNQIQKMITPPKGMNKLVKVAASQDFSGAIKQIYDVYASGDANWQTKGFEIFSNYSERSAEKESFSQNYNAFENAIANPQNFIPKKSETLGKYYNGSQTLEEFYEKVKKDPSVQGLLDPNNLHIYQTSFKPKIPIQNYISKVYDDIEPVQLGKEKKTQIVLKEKDADDVEKLYKIRPNSIEAASIRLLNDNEFIEQYIATNKKLEDIDPMNIGAKERERIREELIESGKSFVLQKFPNDAIKIYTGDVNRNTPAGFNKTVSLAKYQIAGKNGSETKQAPLFGTFKPLEEPAMTIANYKGSITRQGIPAGNEEFANVKFTGMHIIPFKIDKGVERGVFSPNSSDLQSATGFQVYYQFGGGDVYVPVSQMANLQLNAGSKDAVARQDDALKEQQKFAKELNEYHKKVKAGTIKNPLLYKKIEENSKGLITDTELNTFISTFKYDK